MIDVKTATTSIATLVVIGQVIALGLAYFLIKPKSRPAWFGRWALPAAFVVALVSMAGSLYFSEVAKYNPCELCWFQRILMYPLVAILAVALVRKERLIAPYVMVLTAIGAVIAGYHYSLQLGVSPLVPCSAAIGSCAAKQTMTYGYITIPVMAATGFILIFEAMVVLWQDRRATSSPV
ncbi:MAG: disulfide bond formation protein B [Candidatus Kerfeldbacteria bacterium]|nr:disulfide bond formation protein B [Candidatus Kerfeldbacteria bacterium]